MENQLQAPGLIGVGGLLKGAWQIYKTRFKTLLVLALIPTAVSVIFSIPIIFAGLLNPKIFTIALAVLSIPAIVVSIWSAVAILFAIKEREQKIGIKEALAKGWPKILSYLWVSILGSLFIIGGLFLFIVPGIIFGVWFGLATVVLVNEDIKGMSALFRSKQLVSGKWLSVFWRFFAASGLFIVVSVVIKLFISFFLTASAGEIFESIISLFLAPLYLAYSFLIYEDLKRLKSGAAFDAPKPSAKAKYIIAAILGLLLIPALLLILPLFR